MRPDEAARFSEDDEDPRDVAAKFGAGEKGVTRAPDPATAQIRWGLNYMREHYGDGQPGTYADGGRLPPGSCTGAASRLLG